MYSKGKPTNLKTVPYHLQFLGIQKYCWSSEFFSSPRRYDHQDRRTTKANLNTSSQSYGTYGTQQTLLSFYTTLLYFPSFIIFLFRNLAFICQDYNI